MAPSPRTRSAVTVFLLVAFTGILLGVYFRGTFGPAELREMSTAIRTAVLTVSDTASQNASADRSGPTIREILGARPGFSCDHHAIVPDDVLAIQKAVTAWTVRGDVDLIITTGGTGFGARDRTPEAISPLIERHASGIVHLLLSDSVKHTPLAALSRPVAGTIKNTLVVTFPGSPKAVKENLESLFSAGIGHAVDLIRGGTGAAVHAELAKSVSPSSSGKTGSDGHHHHHGHDHHNPQPRSTLSHDPSAPVSERHRISPYPLISKEEAFRLIQTILRPLGTQTLPVTPSLRNYILAEDVHAPRNVPFTSTTSVDGYALRSTDPPGIYRVVTPQTHALSADLPPGTIFRINTGAPLPAGADTIIMVEDTRLVSTHKNADGTDGEEKEVETLAQVPPGDNVRAPGSDVRQGDLVLQKGERILSGGGEVGTLTFVGCKKVEVFRRPVVAILSTGNEIVDLQSPKPFSANDNDGWNGIFDTNRPSLQSVIEGLGYEVVDLGIVPDEIDAHVDTIRKGLESADILLTTGGTSMGPGDLLKPVIERHFNGTIHFGRITIKPGKPTTFATIALPGGDVKPLFALPGNPASALVTFNVFVVPALRRLGGWPEELCHLPRVHVQLQSGMNLDSRTEFHRLIIKSGKDGFKAFSTGGQRSSRVGSLSGANGLAILPPKKVGSPTRLEAGTIVEAIVIGEIQML